MTEIRHLMANDMAINFQGIRELKAGVTLEQAKEATKSNGMDEVFFEAGGKNYVAFSEDSGPLFAAKGSSFFTFNGKPAAILHFNDETNSFLGGVADMGKLLVKTAAKPLMALKPLLPNASTAMTFAGGVALGALTRAGDIQTTTRIGLAIGAAGGVGTVRGFTDETSKSDGAKVAKAAVTGAASVAVGAVMPEVVKLIAKIPIPDIVNKSAAVVGVAALSGTALALVGGGIHGATKEADMKTIEAIAQ